jgi:predicted RNA-binding Zn-ribbon protein involved in translation (DUF1610 family)
MIKSVGAQEEIWERIAEKNRGSVYLASREDLEKYLSIGCSVSGCGGDVELLRDEEIPELIKGYRCVKCGLNTLYPEYVFFLEG